MSDFEEQIDKIVINTKEKMLVVVRESIKDVAEEAQKTRKHGGKMRVDTGFLRSTGVAAINKRPESNRKYRKRKPGEEGILPENVIGSNLDSVLADLKIGDILYFGWTANYAKHRETYDGFLASALQNWKKHVKRSVNKFRKTDFRISARKVTDR